MHPRDLTLEYVVGRLTEEAERRSDRQAELQERRSYSRGGQQQMEQRQGLDLTMAVRTAIDATNPGISNVNAGQDFQEKTWSRDSNRRRN
ncbi:Hypothetical predicted protein, partial [Podarcis lilfordi]